MYVRKLSVLLALFVMRVVAQPLALVLPPATLRETF